MPELPYVEPEAYARIGSETLYRSDPVSLRHIREYLGGTDDWNPLYCDESYAGQTVHGGIIAPPLFFLAACREIVAESELEEDGQYRGFGVEGVHGRSMVGEQELEVLRPLRIGDVVTERQKLAEIQEKQGRTGRLVFVTLDSRFSNQRGEELATAHQIFIFR